MSFKLSCAVVLSVLMFVAVNIGYVESDNSNCAVTGGGPEDCVKITECPAVSSLLDNVTGPVSNITRDYLRQLRCGWYDTNKPKVCCPPDATSLVDKTISGGRMPYSHKNLHLLTKHNCGGVEKDRIVGGSVAGLYEFPWMALLSYNTGKTKEFECGGSLISDKYVLTAAHCITDLLLGVRIGEHDTKSKNDCITFLNRDYCAPAVQDFQFEETIPHKDYIRHNVTNDIALIRLKGTVDLNRRNAKPICLPIYDSLRDVPLEGQSVYVAGWGITEKEKPSDVLLKVSVKVITNAECIKKYNDENPFSDAELHITDNKMCAGEEGKDSCRGDSGGPLVHPGIYQSAVRYIQYGIVSYGTQVCGKGTPGVYTKLTKYMDWILDHMRP